MRERREQLGGQILLSQGKLTMNGGLAGRNKLGEVEPMAKNMGS
jgi:hypothetical protein